MQPVLLKKSLELPCGITIPNRLCKAAMTECMADVHSRSTPELAKLYELWSKGGTGLLITGNIQVDRRYMERPGNVAIEPTIDEKGISALKLFASSATVGGSLVFAQLGHAGRQSTKLLNKSLIGPSAIAMIDPNPEAPADSTTREMTLEEIKDVKSRFVNAALVCQKTGFSGIQLHSAHGYLLSSFLNPLANNRTDSYGGALENRARLLLEIVQLVREAVGPKFPISVKINSSDFQKGGFSLDECKQVLEWLDASSVDLIELSGGNYESPVMLLGPDSTVKREAYFISFAKEMRTVVRHSTLMVTGGFRTTIAMEKALQDGACDMIGIGRPLCVDPKVSKKILAGEIEMMPTPESMFYLPWFLSWLLWFEIGPKLEFFARQSWCYEMMIHWGKSGIADQIPFRAVRGILGMRSYDQNQARNLVGVDCIGSHHTKK